VVSDAFLDRFGLAMGIQTDPGLDGRVNGEQIEIPDALPPSRPTMEMSPVS